MNILKSLNTAALLLALPCLVAGCASGGRNFNPERIASLELGKTRSSDYQTLFGEPDASRLENTADGKFESVRYGYGNSAMGTASVRIHELEFRDGLLNAYQYASSFDADKTKMNSTQLNQLQRGTSKKADVLQMLGRPHRMARCPSRSSDFKDRCGKGAEVWVWHDLGKLSVSGAGYGNYRVKASSIAAVFDTNDVLTDIESVQTNKH